MRDAPFETPIVLFIFNRPETTARVMYACDSFEGMPAPTEDGSYLGVPGDATGWGTGTCAASEASVLAVAARVGVADNLRIIKGDFHETLPGLRDRLHAIAFLHMDSDYYASTMAILQHLYDRLVSGGVIQIDDYGDWAGCKKAVHEYEQIRGIAFDLKPIDGAAVWLSK